MSDWSSDVCSSDLLTDTTTLTLGGRFTYEKRKLTGSLQVVFAGLNGLTVTQPGTTNNSLTANEPTWRLALTQRISPGMMAYASYNRGFKSGGYNHDSPNLATFHPEKIDDFEIAVKRLEEGRVGKECVRT